MQPGLLQGFLIQDLLIVSAKPILMDRFAAKAINAPPKVINLIKIKVANAQRQSGIKE